MVNLPVQLQALVARHIIQDEIEYTVSLVNENIILLIYQYNGLRGEIRFMVSFDLNIINNNLKFINSYKNHNLVEHQVVYMNIDYDEKLLWANSTLNIDNKYSTVELPKSLTPIIMKIISYTTLPHMINVTISKLIEMHIQDFKANVVDGKFKSLDIS